ncbi:hypothetical protein [Kingella oralis]|uniref:hypothetical protein n=1 Tax=Kingella oralis TaxID=505 RepID=UPI002D804A5F|nr:hypothetical protein [Kingella oralis]
MILNSISARVADAKQHHRHGHPRQRRHHAQKLKRGAGGLFGAARQAERKADGNARRQRAHQAHRHALQTRADVRPQRGFGQQMRQAAQCGGGREHVGQRHRLRQNQAADLPKRQQREQAR